ncbi:hypothetical protein SLE2022_024770 [Rubroshorea leprosula]
MLNKNFELDKRGDLFVTVESHAIVVKLVFSISLAVCCCWHFPVSCFVCCCWNACLEKVWEKDIMQVGQLKTGGPLVREWQ